MPRGMGVSLLVVSMEKVRGHKRSHGERDMPMYQRMLTVDRDHFPFLKWKKKKKRERSLSQKLNQGGGRGRTGEENDICVNCLFW